MWAEAGGHAGNDLHGGEGASPAVCGGAAPLSSVAAGSGSSEGVREEGERGGLQNNSRSLASPHPHAACSGRANMLSHCGGGEGNGGAGSSLFGSWDSEGQKKGGTLIITQTPPNTVWKIVTHRIT